MLFRVANRSNVQLLGPKTSPYIFLLLPHNNNIIITNTNNNINNNINNNNNNNNTQIRHHYYHDPSRRDQEAFLNTYHPFRVLNIDEESTPQEIKDQYNKLIQLHAPKGPKPDKNKFERVQRAYDIIIDTESPFYTKAHTSDRNRHRLQLEMLPEGRKRAVQVQVFVLCCFVLGMLVALARTVLAPMQKSLRAATR